MSAIALILLGLFGLVIGSFLNVCIGRLPLGESIVWPGSRCPSCRTAIRWHDNVPVASYLVLGGRCRACRAPIGLRYPLVELATAGAFVLQGIFTGGDWPLLAARLVFTVLLIVLFGTDLETQRLPNVVTLPGIVIGVSFSFLLPPGVADSLYGAALGAGVLLLIRWAWRRATGVDGMGLGDVKMLAMIGAFLGWRQVIVVLFLSSLSGAFVGLGVAALQRKSLDYRLPFGTFLAFSAFVASLVGEALIDWYAQFL
ncbi:MAG: prepilin peptidase [Acidobacteria bacterium]|nr:prepilin peptidase [Acidobacteriota bacterium]